MEIYCYGDCSPGCAYMDEDGNCTLKCKKIDETEILFEVVD